MNSELVHILLEDAIQNFEESFQIESYSGRTMFGRRCVGISCDDALACLQTLFGELLDRLESEEIQELLETLGPPSFDQLGKGQILYWPRCTLP